MDDDERLAEIGREYGSGRMLSGEIKKELIECLTPMIVAHQEARAKVSDAHVDQFFSTAPRGLRACSANSRGLRRSPRRAPVVSFQGSETLVATGAPGPAEVGKGGDGEAAAAAGADGQPLSKNGAQEVAEGEGDCREEGEEGGGEEGGAAAGN